jgi:hypothetical protein
MTDSNIMLSVMVPDPTPDDMDTTAHTTGGGGGGGKPDDMTHSTGGGKPDDPSKECACCFDTLTKSARAPVKCINSNCDFIACKACVRTYLLSTGELPHCMSCKTAWNQLFMVKYLNTSFVNNQYKTHRTKLLLDTQISMLPATMPALGDFQAKEVHNTEQSALRQQINELQSQITIIYQKSRDIQTAFNESHSNMNPDKEVCKFILPCPDEECRGFLSTAYKCEICKLYACAKCLIITGRERTDETHVCDEDLVKTAMMIRDMTKPCPKCGERINKASGCDQMWCTKCETGFNWKTGRLETGIIHNPHFFEWQRTNNNNNGIPRTPGDVICGGLPNNWWQIRNGLREILLNNMNMFKKVCACTEHLQVQAEGEGNEVQTEGEVEAVQNSTDKLEFNIKERQYHTAVIQKFSELFQYLRHVNAYEVERYRRDVRSLNNNEDLRIRYLLNRITKEGMASEVMRRDKKRRKLTEMLYLYELIVVVGNDLINHLVTVYHEVRTNTNASFLICEEFTKKFKEFDIFVDYVNNELKLISVTYSQSVIQIRKSDYMTINQKFNKSILLETSA